MNKKLIESLAALAKVSDVEEFTKALQSEEDESSYDFSKLTVFTEEEKENYKKNVLEHIESVPDNLRSKIFSDAFEIQIKNMKKDLGLDFEGKRQEDFVEAFKSKILKEANVEPSKKIEELNGSLENLRKQLGEKDKAYTELQSAIENDKRKYKVQSLIPELPEGLGLTKDEATALFFMTHEQKEDGIYKNGQRLKDSYEKPLSLEESVSEFVKTKGWSNVSPSGRGGGAGSGAGRNGLPKTIEEYETYIKEKGLNPGSQEANAILTKMAEASTN